MAPKYPDEAINRLAIVFDLLANLITIGSWALSLLVGFALVQQKQPIQLPGLNLSIGSEYQIALLISASLCYLQYLRRLWKRQGGRRDVAATFSDFLINEFFLLKYPLLLISPVFLLTLGFKIGQANDFVSFVCGVIAFFVGPTFFLRRLIDSYIEPQVQEDMNDYSLELLRDKWLQRVDIKMNEKSSVSTDDFFDGVGLSASEYELINVAIRDYFNQFEFEKNLRLNSLKQELYIDHDGQEFQIQRLTLKRRDGT